MVVFGAVPGKASALSNAVYDKLLHFLAYAVLSSLLYLGFTGRPTTRALRTLVAAGTLGAMDEAIQMLMPYRDANWMDWKFDMIAALSCVTLLLFLHLLYSRLTGEAAQVRDEMAVAARTKGTE